MGEVHGFTLLEALIAIAISSFLGLAITSVATRYTDFRLKLEFGESWIEQYRVIDRRLLNNLDNNSLQNIELMLGSESQLPYAMASLNEVSTDGITVAKLGKYKGLYTESIEVVQLSAAPARSTFHMPVELKLKYKGNIPSLRFYLLVFVRRIAPDRVTVLKTDTSVDIKSQCEYFLGRTWVSPGDQCVP